MEHGRKNMIVFEIVVLKYFFLTSLKKKKKFLDSFDIRILQKMLSIFHKILINVNN